MSKTYDVAVVGATGAVGECMLDILASRNFPVGTVYALASERSVGKTVAFGRQELEVENLAGEYLSLLAAGLEPQLLDEAEIQNVVARFTDYGRLG